MIKLKPKEIIRLRGQIEGKGNLPEKRTLSTKPNKEKLIDPSFENIIDLVKQLKLSQDKELGEISEMNLQNIIKSPNDRSFPVINRPALYVREEYKDIYHLLINNSSTGSCHKFIVTGTSGVGKSCFLVYFLIRLLYECENITRKVRNSIALIKVELMLEVHMTSQIASDLVKHGT
ncbi:1586_t:CDS:2 [Entrophospora sp. SA101]|nr:1586_t:CDS:2 [Entrophospora sp. SA101]